MSNSNCKECMRSVCCDWTCRHRTGKLHHKDWFKSQEEAIRENAFLKIWEDGTIMVKQEKWEPCLSKEVKNV